MPTPKQVHLTTKDYDLFLDLYDHLYLDTEYVRNKYYFDSHASYTYTRMTKLEKGGYLKKMKLPLTFEDDGSVIGNISNVYVLDRKGVEEVKILAGDVKWDYRLSERTPLYIYHALQLAHIHESYRAKENDKYLLSEWISEARSYFQYSNNQADVIRPDGIALMAARERKVSFGLMVEMEHSRTRKEITESKLLRYNEYMKTDDEGKTGFERQSVFENKPSAMRVLFVSQKENEMKRLMHHGLEIETESIDILYTTYSQILADPYGKIYSAKDAIDPDEKIYFWQKVERK
jgi:hypothetical protein